MHYLVCGQLQFDRSEPLVGIVDGVDGDRSPAVGTIDDADESLLAGMGSLV